MSCKSLNFCVLDGILTLYCLEVSHAIFVYQKCNKITFFSFFLMDGDICVWWRLVMLLYNNFGNRDWGVLCCNVLLFWVLLSGIMRCGICEIPFFRGLGKSLHLDICKNLLRSLWNWIFEYGKLSLRHVWGFLSIWFSFIAFGSILLVVSNASNFKDSNLSLKKRYGIENFFCKFRRLQHVFKLSESIITCELIQLIHFSFPIWYESIKRNHNSERITIIHEKLPSDSYFHTLNMSTINQR